MPNATRKPLPSSITPCDKIKIKDSFSGSVQFIFSPVQYWSRGYDIIAKMVALPSCGEFSPVTEAVQLTLTRQSALASILLNQN